MIGQAAGTGSLPPTPGAGTAVAGLPTQRAEVPSDRDQGPDRRPAGRVALLVLDASLGLAADAARLVRSGASAVGPAVRPAVRLVLRPPLVGERYWPATQLRRYAERGQVRREAAEQAAAALVLSLVPVVTEAVLDQLDLTRLVRERVDLDTVVAGVDVNKVALALDLDAVAARLDVDAVAARLDLGPVVDRIDLVGIATSVIDAIDLPEIVRESTGALASETVVGVRMRTVEADERLTRVVDRILRRRRESDGVS
ncbi:MAG: hypothetical protein ACRDV1_03790 [Actinomycetes bacterium]